MNKAQLPQARLVGSGREPRAMNPHERLARAAKVEKLVGVIDAIAIDRELCPLRGAMHVARTVIDLLDEHGWAELAREAKCNPPSADTIRAVRRVYEQREMQAADEYFEGCRSRLGDLS